MIVKENFTVIQNITYIRSLVKENNKDKVLAVSNCSLIKFKDFFIKKLFSLSKLCLCNSTIRIDSINM